MSIALETVLLYDLGSWSTSSFGQVSTSRKISLLEGRNAKWTILSFGFSDKISFRELITLIFIQTPDPGLNYIINKINYDNIFKHSSVNIHRIRPANFGYLKKAHREAEQMLDRSGSDFVFLSVKS